MNVRLPRTGFTSLSGGPEPKALWASFLAAVLLAAPAFARFAPGNIAALPKHYGYEIVAKFPHDTMAFTQGLLFHDGFLYESTGLNGRSSIRRVYLDSGIVLDSHAHQFRIFAEGIAVNDSVIVQLTWRNRRGFVYSVDTIDTVIREFTYEREGWGLAFDGDRFIMSDGSTSLRLFDPIDFRQTGELEIREAIEPYPSWRIVPLLNELEYVNGEIYANIWKTDRIAIINPKNGRVRGWIDLSGLLPWEERTAEVDVLNGIAYDSENDRLFVTGKLWPWVFEIRLRELSRPAEPYPWAGGLND